MAPMIEEARSLTELASMKDPPLSINEGVLETGAYSGESDHRFWFYSIT